MPQLAMPILDGAPDVTYYRWRQKIGRLTSDQVTRLKELEFKTRALSPSANSLQLSNGEQFHRLGVAKATRRKPILL